MDRIDAMQAFVAVADLQGFAPAGRKLRLSPWAVTRLIAALEERLGARLLQRTTRSVTLTDAGTRYLERARRIPADVEAAPAERTARGVRASGVWTAACQPGHGGLSAALWRCVGRTAAGGPPHQSRRGRHRSRGPHRLSCPFPAGGAACRGNAEDRRGLAIRPQSPRRTD